MSILKTSLTALVAIAAAAISSAEDLNSTSAVRPEHGLKFGAHRVNLEQLHAAATEAERLAAEGEPPNPDAEAFAALSADLAAARQAAGQALANDGNAELLARIETMALTVDDMADKLAAFLAAKR